MLKTSKCIRILYNDNDSEDNICTVEREGGRGGLHNIICYIHPRYNRTASRIRIN